MITEHHETRFLLLAPHHQNIVDGDVRGEHLHLLDNTCPGLTLLVNKRGDLYDSTSCGPDKQDISGDSIDQRHSRINRDGGELLMRTGPDEVRLLGGGINSLVHQRVFLDKVEIFLIQRSRVIVTGARSGVWLLVFSHRKPVCVAVSLALEWPVKTVNNFTHPEAADRASADCILRRVEDSENYFVTSRGVHHLTHGLDLVKIKRIGSRHGTVQPSFHEACPLIPEGARSSSILLADPGNPTVDSLK